MRVGVTSRFLMALMSIMQFMVFSGFFATGIFASTVQDSISEHERFNPVPVSTIAQLRSSPLNQQYILTGQAILTYQQTWRNQKFVQDATAAILLDDATGIITTPYNLWDGITGITGILRNHNGMLRLQVTANPGPPTSSGNVITPEVVTLQQLYSDFMAYQSELVKITSVTFANGGLTFVEGNNYPVSDPSGSGVFRTEFYDANYLYTTIPTVPCDLVVIPHTVSGSHYITSRFLSDIQPTIQLPSITVISPNGYEYWERGTSQNIVWTSQNFTGNVRIILFRPPLYQLTLVDNYPNAGIYVWQIPANQPTASNYKIRIQGTQPGDPMDESNDFFSIVAQVQVPKIVINEIMYYPSPLLGTEENFEYVEIFNNSSFQVDLSGWSFSEAIQHTFAQNTLMNPGSFLVIARNASAIAGYYGISNIVQWTSGTLSNTGATIRLNAPNGQLMDIVTYSSSNPWPSAPNGNGPSLELIHPDLDNSLPQHWKASTILHGTPGTQNSVFGFQGLTINSPNGGEMLIAGNSYQITWTSINFTGLIRIELLKDNIHAATLAVNVPAILQNWNWQIPLNQSEGSSFAIRISDMDDGEPWDISDGYFSIANPFLPSITVISPNGGEQIEQMGTFEITWSAINYQGVVVIELLTEAPDQTIILGTSNALSGAFLWYVNQPAGNNYRIKISDSTSGFPFDVSDGFFSIVPPPPPKIVISEIMYNPPESPFGSLEYIELYNADYRSFNLLGWSFSSGVTFVFPSYQFVPGTYVVIAANSVAIQDAFAVTSLQWNNGETLSDSGELIELKDSQGNVIDMVFYQSINPWPEAAAGFGPSLSLIDPDLDNALPDSWLPETKRALSIEGFLPVYGSPGSGNFPTPAQGILLPEGWSGISSYIIPVNLAISVVVELLKDHLEILQSFHQVYFPGYKVNTLINWDNSTGYQIKMNVARYHVISGSIYPIKTVVINKAGWYGLPVLSKCPVNVSELFGNLPGLIILKEMAGEKMFWPQQGINTLQELQPGRAYFLKTAFPVVITFPICEPLRME